MANKGKSALWNYFSKESEMEAKCTSCQRLIPNKGNTTNLRYHLQARHPVLYNKMVKEAKLRLHESKHERTEGYIDDDDDLNESKSNSLQSDSQTSDNENNAQSSEPSTSTKSSVKTEKTNCFQLLLSKRQKQKIDHALAYYIVKDMLPYKTVENEGFQFFCKTLNPAYPVPSRKTLTTLKIPSLYSKTKEAISTHIKNAEFLCFTTDCWTSAAKQPYIALTAHYIDSFSLESRCLGCYYLVEDHTAENIADALMSMLCEWDVNENKIVAFTTDYGSNIILAIEQLNKAHIPCFGHTINTAVSRALLLPDIQPAIKKVKEIQAKFAHSWKLERELHEIQDKLNVPRKNIPSFSKTRWWSLLNLIKVILSQELVLLQLFKTYKKGDYKHLILDDTETEILKELVAVLTPVQQISEHLAGETYVTVSSIIPVCYKLKQDFEEKGEETQIDTQIDSISKKIMTSIFNTLRQRYSETDEHRRSLTVKRTKQTLLLCTLLDPRFKTHFCDEQDKILAKSVVLQEVRKFDIDPDCNNHLHTPTSSKSIPDKKLTGLAAIFDVTNASTVTTIEEELEFYLKENTINIDEDPLQWWKTHSSQYKRLAMAATKFLSIPGTSVPSERIFSRGGLIVTDNRTSLSDEHVEELIFLSMNSKFIPKFE